MPEPGYYRTRLVKAGPWSRVLIFRPCPLEFEPETFQSIDRWPHLMLSVNGEPRDFPDDLTVVGPADVEKWVPAFERWPAINPISFREYDYLSTVGNWAITHSPEAPEANPREPVDVGTIVVIF